MDEPIKPVVIGSGIRNFGKTLNMIAMHNFMIFGIPPRYLGCYDTPMQPARKPKRHRQIARARRMIFI